MSDKLDTFFPEIAEQIRLRENQNYVPEEMQRAKTFELKEENMLFGYDEQGRTVFIDEPKKARIKTYHYDENGALTKGEWCDNRKIFEDYLKANPTGPSKNPLKPGIVPSFNPYQITLHMKRLVNEARSGLSHVNMQGNSGISR